MDKEFTFEQVLQDLRSGMDLLGSDGVLAPLVKQLTKAALQAELDAHLETEDTPNRKNGYSSKTVKSASGSFEPQLVKKHQTHLTDEVIIICRRRLDKREINNFQPSE